MQRLLEVVVAGGTHSRLTIAPERITVKVAPDHAEMADAWTVAATAIAERIDLDRSLRGRFRPDRTSIWLSTDTSGWGNRRYFLYDFNGELLREADEE